MALNFDAKLTLDVSEFLASIKRAENAVDGLKKKLAQPMPMGGATGTPSGVPARQEAANQQAGKQMADSVVKNSARARYALYDVAAAYKQIERIAVDALKAMIGTAAEYERSFVNVARTTEFQSVKIGEAARAMKYSLTELATQIPVSFSGITEIATIGNQLGIAQGKLVSFSKAVAQFSSITGVGIESAALSFGRIGELLSSAGEQIDYNQLGSSIAYAGVKAVATEAQILSVTKEIATTAKMAKFTAPEVVGLATALSSLGIAPEAARGSIIRTFALINQAVGEGGTKLSAYASVAGLSAKKFSSEWTKNGQVAFDKFLSGLQGMSDKGQNLDTVLRGLGIHNVRDIQTIQKLGDNYNVYAEGIANANKGFSEGIFLSAAYGQIQETVSAKLTIIQNQWNNFLASAGDASFPGIKFLLDIVGKVIDQLNSFARNPFGKVILTMTTVALGLVAAIAAINAIVAISKATMMAYATAMEIDTAAVQAKTGSIEALILAEEGLIIAEEGAIATTEAEIVALEGATVAGNAAAGGITKASIAMKALSVAGKAVVWIAAIYAAIEVVGALGDAWQKATDSTAYYARKAEESLGGFAGLQDAVTSDFTAAMEQYGSVTAISAAIASGALNGMTVDVESNTEAAKQARDAANGYAEILGSGLTDGVNSASDAIQQQTVILGENYDAWIRNQILNSGNFKDLATDTETVKQLKAVGFSFDGANNAAKKGKKSLDDYYTSLIENAKASGVSSSITGGLSVKLGILSAAGMGGNSALTRFNEALIGSAAEAYLLGNAVVSTADKLKALGDAPEKFITTTETLKKARTIWDYIAEVQTKLKTAFDWRYAAQNAADVLHTGWKKVADDFKAANKNLLELKTTMKGLVADRSILQYQLTIAQKYGDTLRANAIQAELAANKDKITQNTTDQASATDDASRALTGNTDAAIRNRQTMQGLVTSSLDYLTTLKMTSKDTDTLVASAESLKTDFMNQGKALGYNSKELETYSSSFDDFISIVKGTSDKLDVSMDVYLGFTGADAALHKWKTDNASLSITTKLLNPDWTAWDKAQKHIITVSTVTQDEIDAYKSAKSTIKFDKAAHITIPTSLTDIVTAFEKKYGTGFATGGLVTGPGNATSDSIRANLSNGEYVVKAAAVSRVGVGFLNALNNQQGLTMPASAMVSTTSSSGSNIVYLSPADRALLREAIDRPVNLYTENTRIAQSANAGNVLLAQRGKN